MPDFQFLKNSVTKKWVISAPRRAKRPDVGNGDHPICPFCPGREGEEPELYRVPHASQDWLVRVIPNKFPFAPIHELVIHSPEHDKSFIDLPPKHVEAIFQTYRYRYNEHAHKGQVYIFHNRGEMGGESLPHSHTQIAVAPDEVWLETPELSSVIPVQNDKIDTKHFMLTCPPTSQWPDEVWIAPQTRGKTYGAITDEEISDLSQILIKLLTIYGLRHGDDFPFNFYIYPGENWYLRLIPRDKRLGGFEVGTGIFVNTQDPQETIAFIKSHFHTTDPDRIKKDHKAQYVRHV